MVTELVYDLFQSFKSYTDLFIVRTFFSEELAFGRLDMPTIMQSYHYHIIIMGLEALHGKVSINIVSCYDDDMSKLVETLRPILRTHSAVVQFRTILF